MPEQHAGFEKGSATNVKRPSCPLMPHLLRVLPRRLIFYFEGGRPHMPQITIKEIFNISTGYHAPCC